MRAPHVTPMQQRLRLTETVRVIEGTEDAGFNMMSWFDQVTFGPGDDVCGTTACAVGCAAQDPWFNERGLTLEKNPNYKGKDIMVTLTFLDLHHFDAVMAFYGLNEQEVDYLFTNEAYEDADIKPTRVAVIARIQDFILRGMPGEDDCWE